MVLVPIRSSVMSLYLSLPFHRLHQIKPLHARMIYTTGTSTTAASSNMITDLLNTAFTAAVVTGLVGIVAPLFSPPPSQQRSDAASSRAEQALRAGRDQWGGYWG